VIGSTYSGASAAPANGLLVEGQVGFGTTSPSASAAVEISSSTTGFLQPRMSTAQMNAIASPAEGLTVYNTTLRTLCWFDGSSWTYVPQDGKSCGTINYEGKTYETVVIGLQCWMKQNLNVGTRIDGIAEQTDNSIIEKYCTDNNEANCDTYGGFYQWGEMMNWTTSSSSNPSGRQGICPVGWHIPSDPEWCQMETYLDKSLDCNSTMWRGTDAGNKLKSTSGWVYGGNGNNSSGFTALPAGFLASDQTFDILGWDGLFWSSTASSASSAWSRYLRYQYAQINRNEYPQVDGFSIRCIKD
jgi:uncharacterized protein (TIGR02145 family)